ncbi:MAG: hypothetical protein CL767_02090 [Chloroflexi bacterium]|nr:hypothetical protein [Chloroflexota bacterium]MQG11543.1 hypothetical protein [SAR202 cluster bacterium]|tara:strand:- start:58 stop:255 length:198 start_codon:yes stop_codon:yes gene_type:complete
MRGSRTILRHRQGTGVGAPASKLLGYNRNTEAIKDRMDGVIAALLSEGRLEDDGDHLVLGTPSEN